MGGLPQLQVDIGKSWALPMLRLVTCAPGDSRRIRWEVDARSEQNRWRKE